MLSTPEVGNKRFLRQDPPPTILWLLVNFLAFAIQVCLSGARLRVSNTTHRSTGRLPRRLANAARCSRRTRRLPRRTARPRWRHVAHPLPVTCQQTRRRRRL